MRTATPRFNVLPTIAPRAVVAAFAASALAACGPSTAEDFTEPVDEQSLAWTETTCATNASNIDETFTVDPPQCGYGFHTTDSVSDTYGHSDCSDGWVTEFTSTYGERIVVGQPTWAGGALSNQIACVSAYMSVRVWGQNLFGWESPTTSTYQGSWNGTSCNFVLASGQTPFSTSSSPYVKLKLVNTAGYFFAGTVRAKHTVLSGDGPC